MPPSKPIHMLADEQAEAAKLEEFYIDLGLPAEQVREQVAHRRLRSRWTGTLEQVGDCVIGQSDGRPRGRLHA